MINNITIIGILKGKSEGSNFRLLEVERDYKDSFGKFNTDSFKVMYWNKNEKNPLFSYKENSLIAIKGRLEVIENSTYIIAENVTFLSGQNFAKSL